MNLAIDIGNSRLKIAWFERERLHDRKTFQLPFDVRELRVALASHPIGFTAIANVNQINLDELISLVGPNHIVISSQTKLPIKNNYGSPESLGIDRICAAVAANYYFPKNHVLSIDMGTCITYDLIDRDGVYQGGGIAPGYEMRLKAMHRFTERLPFVVPQREIVEFGKDTKSSLLFGAGTGIVAEINGIIERFVKIYPELKVILTGGDHSLFEQHVENAIFAAPNLVLEGINQILRYNISLND